MTERNYNMGCPPCPNTEEWAAVQAETKDFFSLMSAAGEAGANLALTQEGKEADESFSLIAGELANRATFEGDLNRVERQNCGEVGHCRLLDFWVACGAYAERGKQAVQASRANLREDGLQSPE
jgi:hypothetical protein